MKKIWSYLAAGRQLPADEDGEKPPRPSYWLRLTQFAAVLAGYFLVASWVLLERAKPQTHTMFDWRWDKKVRASWNMTLAALSERFLMVTFCLSVFGLLVWWLTREGYTTRTQWVLAVFGVLSLISLIYCEMSF